MALRDIHESVMLQIAETFTDPENLRPVLESHPMLSVFVPRFEKVEKLLLAAQDNLGSGERNSLRNGIDALRTALSPVETRYDDNIRQTFFVLEATKVSENRELAEQAETLQSKLLPNGRTLVRFSVERKIGDAWGANKRLDPPDQDIMNTISAPETTLAELHRIRLEIADELKRLNGQLGKLEAAELEKGVEVIEARSQWLRLIRTFQANVAFAELDPEKERLVTQGIERASELGSIRRSRAAARAEEGASTGASAGDGSTSTAADTSTVLAPANDVSAPAPASSADSPVA